ncbi:hypothetical protein ScPMuIL_014401 [Solemya velum]
MRSALLIAFSFVLTAVVVGNAYYQKEQFYPSVVYLTKSNPSMAILYLQAFVFVILMGKLMRKIFFGQLRAAEMEHLIERSWYAVTETCLAFTVFRDDFSPKFVALFTLLLFLKCFHWLAEDRVDYMERSPVISLLFHVRVLSLIGVLGFLDLYYVNHAYYSTLLKGASVQLVFGFEYAILLTAVMMVFVKYVLHSVDLQSDNPWENKAVYLLYTELILGFFKVVLYVTFMVIMIKVHTFPLFAIRPMYLSMRSFKKALHDVIMSRRAIRNMNTLYPDATPEELQAGDNVCIICREEMVSQCKKLLCNHIFHTSCLRSWFQRQQTCPTCRMDVLRMPRPQTTQQTPAPPPQQNQQPAQPQMPNMFPGMYGMPMWAPPPPLPPRGEVPPREPPTPPQSPPSTTPPAQGQAAGAPGASAPPPPPGVGSPPLSASMAAGASAAYANPYSSMFSYMTPFAGFPQPPQNMQGLSEEELATMEGRERQNVEARIQWLRDIQALLDGAMVLINQYNTVAAQTSIPGIAVAQTTQSNYSPSSASNTTQPTNSNADKTSSQYKEKPISKEETKSNTLSSEQTNSSVDEGLSELDGAVGYTPPKEEFIPEWDDPRNEEHQDELHKIRHRRLQRFSEDNNSIKKEEDDLEMD